MSLTVDLAKLERYCRDQGGYDLELEGAKVKLSFVPNFPEATEKADSETPRVTLTGELLNNRVHFRSAEIEDSLGTKSKDEEELALVYRSWLEYIEDNY